MFRYSSQISLQTGGKVRHAGRRLYKVGLFLFSLFLFMLAIALMKESAHGLTPLLRDTFRATTPLRSLGFGWLFAYVVLSGSPVAAVALTFLDAGVRISVNTDDPSMFGQTLAVELRRAGSVFGLGRRQMRDILVDAVDQSWLSEPEKSDLRTRMTSDRHW